MKCDYCGNEIGRRPDGIPNGIGFALKDGTQITLCADCLIELGKMSDSEKDEFFRNIRRGDADA